jgi:hypothetical protein
VTLRLDDTVERNLVCLTTWRRMRAMKKKKKKSRRAAFGFDRSPTPTLPAKYSNSDHAEGQIWKGLFILCIVSPLYQVYERIEYTSSLATLPISGLRNRPYFTKKRLSHPFGKSFVSLFSIKLNGQSALKFNKDMDVHCICCMMSRTPGCLGWIHFFAKCHSNRSLF